MAKQGTNMFWATLMPVFAPQPKDEPLLTYNNGLLMYIRHDQKITFSSSVLEAMEAVAPIVSVGNILKSSTWDGPLIFQNYVLENSALGFQTVTKPISTAEAEKMHNEFLVNSGLYVYQVSSGLLIPNPNYDLSTAVMDSALMGMSMPSGKGVGTTKKELIAITGEEFYQLLLPDTYGFSTTLIYPNQSLVDGIIEKMKKSKKEEDDAKETSFEEFIKALKEGDNPYVDPKDPYPKDPWKKKPDPWGPSPGTRIQETLHQNQIHMGSLGKNLLGIGAVMIIRNIEIRQKKVSPTQNIKSGLKNNTRVIKNMEGRVVLVQQIKLTRNEF